MDVSAPLTRFFGPREARSGVAEARASFEAIYDAYADFVWRSARRLGVSDAAVDDIVQQVFVTVHRRMADFQGRSSAKTWIFAILLKTVSEHRRLVRRKSPHLLHGDPTDPDDLGGDAGDPHTQLERARAAQTIERLLQELGEEERVVFLLAELEQMSAAEIAEATGRTIPEVYSRLRAARADFERAAARLRRDERHRELAWAGTGASKGGPR